MGLVGFAGPSARQNPLDAAFRQFLSILPWICWKRDVYFTRVDCRGTSQMCPVCDADVPKDLSIRVHACTECRYTTDRDVASAQVVKKRGLRLITADGQSVLQNAWGDGLTGVAMSSQESLRRKPQERSWESPTINVNAVRERFSGGRMPIGFIVLRPDQKSNFCSSVATIVLE